MRGYRADAAVLARAIARLKRSRPHSMSMPG
jgi:hypothetical protein